ncbi:DUF2924 domain-containing protein [Microvirga pudoricolor]|uniref:DUF2924 domain-containing protein n=1 Tax=Microvirga pudoricolor TaxID=2778729 RepID=UPI00194FC951|nr:DUF2924 domain-containing protein [Microvirga pudoricolor]MBM6595051.1 DUF2924 domain-containing protein [Microvirga pudoricolor]
MSRNMLNPTQEVASATSDPLSAEIGALTSLDLHELRVRWRKLFRTQAPPHLSRALLLRIIAYKIQAKALGDLDRDTARFLERLGRQQAADKKKRAIPPVPQPTSIKPGTLLVREHDGIVHQVIVLENGFAWNSTPYKSLSEIARAITGTNWNGPRFFGLRDKAKAAIGAVGGQP